MQIKVVGIGYVGLATAALWAIGHDVTAVDVVQDKVDSVNCGKSPFEDSLIDTRLARLANDGHPLEAAPNVEGALTGADMVFVAVPTNYNEEAQRFDTRIVESVFAQAATECPNALVVLRSTVQPGTTGALAKAYGLAHVLYCPEFLREGRSLEDCLRPNRIVVGADEPELSDRYCAMLKNIYEANGELIPSILLCSIAEAEAAKLFANAYLATRVAFFNELDSFALHRGLDAAKVIQAVCLDERIGAHYNNPSFGYGGYCLPKDTKALLHSFGDDVPNDLISATVKANEARKNDLVDYAVSLAPKRVGVYRLVAKHGSDNLRSSALRDVVATLVQRGQDVLVYEPLLDEPTFCGAAVANSLDELLESCDLVLANRMADELSGYSGTLLTRDLYHRD